MIQFKPEYDSVNFSYRISIFKDGEKITSFNSELMDDLTYRSPDTNPFKGPKFTKEEMAVEIMTMMKNDCDKLNDTSVEELLNEFNHLIKDYKIKVWGGEYLPFTKD